MAVCRDARKGRDAGSHWSKPVVPPLHSTSNFYQFGSLIGVVVGMLIGNRYDLKPAADTGVAWRIDHWTGKSEIIGPNGNPVRFGP